MTELKNDRYLRALLRQPVDVTPVWMMRQAGRYLPEYKATRAQAGDFMSLCKNAELACEVTLQPLRRYPLDAAILFSDILTIPDAMGLGLYFEAGEGPRFTSPVKSKADVDKLPIPDPEQELGYVMNAVRTIRRELKGEVPLIGFSGSPWTLATYMVEGGSSKAFTVIKKMMYAEPQALHALLDKLAKSVTLYLNAQIKAGAQSVMIFDTWGGRIEHRRIHIALQRYFVTHATAGIGNIGGPVETQRIAAGLRHRFQPLTTAFGEQSHRHAAAFVFPQQAIDDLMHVVEGELLIVAAGQHPAPGVKNHHRLRAGFGQGEGHVFNLGHGIHQDVDPEHAGVFVEAVHRLSAPYHQ